MCNFPRESCYVENGFKKVRELLDEIWKHPKIKHNYLSKVLIKS